MKYITLLILAGVIAMTTSSYISSVQAGEDRDERQWHGEQGVDKGTMLKGNRIMKKMSFGEHISMYWQFFFGKEETTPKNPLPMMTADLDSFYSGQDDLKAIWLGHSSLLIKIDDITVLTDPVFEKKVSIVGPKSFHKRTPLNIDQLVHVDVVVISHDHYDHLNKYSVKKLADKASIFVVPLRVGERLVNWGVPPSKIIELAWWEEYTHADTLTIAATPSQHFSGRGLFDRNRTLWASWVLKTSNHSLFFSGDSGYFGGFKEIGEKFGPFDIAYLECGAYDERWSNIHMLPEETVQAFIDLKGSVLQPIHWATFNLALHAWYEPVERLMSAAWSNGVTFSSPMIGEVINYGEPVAARYWWQEAMKTAEPGEKEKGNYTKELVSEIH